VQMFAAGFEESEGSKIVLSNILAILSRFISRHSMTSQQPFIPPIQYLVAVLR